MISVNFSVFEWGLKQMKKCLGFFQRPAIWMWFSVLMSLILISWSAVDWVLNDLKQAAFDFGLAILVSVFIYVLISWWPEKRKKAALQSYLNSRHDELLDELIPHYLSACDQGSELGSIDQLKDQQFFRQFFKVKFNDTQTRWDAVTNRLLSEDGSLINVLVALKRFQTEIDFCVTLSAVNVEQGGFSRLRHISQDLKRVREQAVIEESDGVKQMSKFLWSLHTGWSFVEGYSGRDHVKESIVEGFTGS